MRHTPVNLQDGTVCLPPQGWHRSWVINHSGWDVGRLGAQGLYNICTPTSAPRPGDLVFFEGTYDTSGVSHCGIYVGDGMMIHAGDPISYANLNTSYWQSHFYAYGRLP